MSNKGNQSGTDIVEEGETIGTVYNPGHATSDPGTPRDVNINLSAKQDISYEAKVTLGDYLGRLTSGEVGDTGKNTYAVNTMYSEPGNLSEVNVNLSERDPDANLDQNPTLGTFLDVVSNSSDDGPDAKEAFKSLKHSEYVKGTNPFVGTSVKDTNTEGGHTLLASTKRVDTLSTTPGNPVVPTGADADPSSFPVHQRKISQVLKRNRFNPSGDTPFMEGHEKTNFGYTVQTKMGEYDTTADPVDPDKLKKVGVELIINATGHTGLDATDFDWALLPTLAQYTGFSIIDEDNMRPQNTTSGVDVTKIRTNLLNGTNARKSYGHLNSKIEPFDGPMPLGMVVNSLAGMISLIAFSALITAITGGFSASASDPSRVGAVPYNAPHKLRKGRHAAKTEDVGNMFLELFGIPKTDHHWTLCMFRGILAFYGLSVPPSGDGPPPSPMDIIESFLNIAMAPGYYNVVTRNVIRDTEQVADAITDFADVGASPAGIIMGIFKLIEAIVNSSTYRFLMAMTALGNQILSGEIGHPNLSAHGDRNVDSLEDTSGNRHKKSRRSYGGGATGVGRSDQNALTWRHAAAPSRYLLPKEFMSALDQSSSKLGLDSTIAVMDKIIGYKDGDTSDNKGISDHDLNEGWSNLGNGKAKFDKSTINGSVPGRLPKEYVEWIENQLDTEYMPFYFHDLRTNEIISFHAFLNDLSDGFSTDYSSMSGYGRADDVMIYNKTSRNISLSFTVAATSEQDLDIMYFNINKLVSMMYPQYSRGRVVAHGEGRATTKFVQPFSQIPTASPMIRLRFGDMIKSNYSKFNIARLFGLGQSTDSFNITAAAAVDDKTMEEWAAKRDAAIKAVNIREMKENIDPGGGNDTQAAASAAVVTAGGSAVTSDDEWGYTAGSRVILDPAILYWPRDSSGKQARENDEKRSSVGSALDLFSYGTHSPEVEIIGRASTAGAATPNSFSALLAKSPSDPAAEADEQSGKEMAYLVKAKEGEPAYAALSYTAGAGAGYNFHRAEHSEIIGWSSAWRAELIEGAMADPEDPALSVEVFSNTAALISNFFNGDTSNDKANPVIRSFESARGRGLAGFMTELSFDYADMPWETTFGKRAPQMMKVSVTFKPIHDVPMGLDSTGMMRSVAYPVGLSGQINGDVYEDGHAKARAAKGAATKTTEASPKDDSGADAAKKVESDATPGL